MPDITDKSFANLKPGERVKAYLSSEFKGDVSGQEIRIPPIRKIAAELKISLQTAQRSLQQLAATGRVRTEVGNGTFYCPVPRSDFIRIILCFPELSMPLHNDWEQINTGIIYAALHHTPRISVTPFSTRGGQDGCLSNLIDELDHADGMIMFSYINQQEEILRASEAKGKPVVFFNPSRLDIRTANFVSPDSFAVSLKLGQAMRASGRKHALVILSPHVATSVSNTLRYAGFVSGFGIGWDRNATVAVCEPARTAEEFGYKAVMERMAQPHEHYDIVYCSGDLLALGAVKALKEHGVKVPEETSVVGCTGLDFQEIMSINLTRFVQPFNQMGRELIHMLCERIEKNGAEIPGRHLPYGIAGGGTTRPEENVLLGLK